MNYIVKWWAGTEFEKIVGVLVPLCNWFFIIGAHKIQNSLIEIGAQSAILAKSVVK